MSSVAEIEAAIERLSPAEVKQVASWLADYQQVIRSVDEMLAFYDKQEAGRA